MMRKQKKYLCLMIWLAVFATPIVVSANNFEGNADDIDGDGVANRQDLDSDNDGILDSVECANTTICPDFDADGIPDFLDIDSDGDGITDAHEAFGNDADGDGQYDGFEDQNGDGADDGIAEAGTVPVDSDGDQSPDHLDLDSDDDGLSDAVEGHDLDGDGVADALPNGKDIDLDGLDDAFDAHCYRVDLCRNGATLEGTPAPTPDLDGDGVEDFRQPELTPNPDAGGDAGSDAGNNPDAGSDAGSDAGHDAGSGDFDAGRDGGNDGGDPGSDATIPDTDGPSFEDEFYVDGGGCTAVPTGSPAPWWWALFLAMAFLRRNVGRTSRFLSRSDKNS